MNYRRRAKEECMNHDNRSCSDVNATRGRPLTSCRTTRLSGPTSREVASHEGVLGGLVLKGKENADSDGDALSSCVPPRPGCARVSDCCLFVATRGTRNKGIQSSTASCLYRHSSFPFPIPLLLDFNQHEVDNRPRLSCRFRRIGIPYPLAAR